MPDLQGFVDAQKRLRDAMGTDVTFRLPVDPEWPGGTAVDENGKPFDPTIDPLPGTGGFTEVVKRCSLVQGLVRAAADFAENEAAGMFRSEKVVLGLDPTDYAAVAEATEVVVGDVTYSITQSIIDPAMSLNARWLFYGEAK